jgi:arylesterase / paraoxonase
VIFANLKKCTHPVFLNYRNLQNQSTFAKNNFPLKQMKKALKITLIILLLLGIYITNTLYQAGYFKTMENHFEGTTQKINGLVGTEDISIDQSTGFAFLSSDDRWAFRLRKETPKGSIYGLDLNDSIPKLMNLTVNFPIDDFHPHGISLYNSPAGKKVLFVVNHRKSGNYIEIFEYKNDSLIHLESITNELLVSPNDIVGVGERSFYFTNDHDEKFSSWRNIKDILKIGTGNVCYFDGSKMSKTSIENIKYANGINVSLDGKTLFLASTSSNKLFVYERNLDNGALTKSDEIDTNTGVDNIELDKEGNLWIGCHPQALKFLTHAKNEKKISPSEIIKITYKAKGNYEQKSVYLNDGSEISASSVGAVYKDKLLIGPVFQEGIIFGKMK